LGLLSFVLVGSVHGPHIIVQAKVEPCYVGFTQLAPAVRATLSNFSQVLGGSAKHYLEIGHPDLTGAEVFAHALKSEQATRFWKKRNRNLLEATLVAPVLQANSVRRPVRESLALVTRDFTLNTDARSGLV
jgi:oxidase EvaA